MTMRTYSYELIRDKSILFFGLDSKTNSKVKSSLNNYVNNIDIVQEIPRYVNLANYDLILVDIDEFNINELTHILSNDFYNTPIIFLTSDLNSVDFNQVQNISVKNILLKEPIFLDNLFIYTYIILQKSDKIILKNDFSYSLKDEKFYHRNVEVSLTKLELKVFEYLIKNVNRVVSYEELKRDVWKNKHCSIYSMRNVINKIREKSYYDIISNASKKGYSINNDYTYF
ncbi:winged helix-turn-helix domain-containing protein [Halarcobacter ebronensis]|uniref:OmpR/PhoB-type domain-containing protein n=1 Tax=Halarcobacter ebronensis TaxID=1462615 RepID=A0A4V1M0P2_9BACT|nr:winged helix-turn-helix domain-containing protein [Halarcobacter ebronensis]QKF82617.1 signal transduction response regulator, OmpR family [Halarcobacter ebronensis]RXK07375.1 hypothetical protein CRV07_02610 [Halarcobacter ebronensis]